MADEWYYKVRGEELGPVTFENISDLVQSGDLGRTDEIRTGQTADWTTAESVVGLFSDPEELTDLGDLDFTFEETAALTPGNDAGGPARVDDLADLDFQLVSSESPADAARATVEEGSPEIPSRVVASNADDNTWFFQSLGQELGPMLFEELCSLAQSGTLDATDQIRHGSQGDWVPAETNPVLSALLSTADSQPVEAPRFQKPDTPVSKRSKSKKKRWRLKTAKKKPAPSPIPAPQPQDDEPIDEDDLEAQTPESAVQATPRERWYCRIDDIEHGPLQHDELKAMAGRGRLKRDDQVKRNDDGEWVAASTISDLFADDETAGAEDGPARSAVDAQIAASSKLALTSAPAKPVKPRKPKRAKKNKPSSGSSVSLMNKLSENKQPVFVLSGILLAIVVVLGLSFLNFGGTAKEHRAALSAIYREHLELRKRKAKDAEWDPLIAKAKELEKTLTPELLRNAGSKRRDLQELLYAVRDFLVPMLEDSHKLPSKNEREFVNHLKLAGKLIENPDYEKETAEEGN